MNNTWDYLSNKTKKSPFLGTLDFKRKVIKKSNELVCITLESKYRNSGLMSLISAFVFCFLTWLAYPHSKFLGNLSLIFLSILFSMMAILFLDYKKRLFWENGKSQIHFLWGFYPFVKTASLDSSKLNVNSEKVKKDNTYHNSKREQIYLSSSNYPNSKIIIMRSTCHTIILSTFKEIDSFLNVTKSNQE